ncbi:MAG: hypothetical protein AAB372_03785 [Patescibacteria group bacterium]
MKGISPKAIPKLIARDVRTVLHHAAIVIVLKGHSAEVRTNKNPALNVIAIIGPGNFVGRQFSKALLCEIGIGASRPYREANIKRGGKRVMKRHKWFTLSSTQYEHLASRLFKLLHAIAANRVATWKSGDRFFLSTTRHWHTKRQKKIVVYRDQSMEVPRGCRFSVSPADELLCADICWAEIHSPRVLRHLQNLARFIDRTLSQYRINGFVRSFQNLGFVKKIKTQLRAQLCISIAPHLLIEMLRHYPHGAKNRLFSDIEDMVFDLLVEDQALEIRELALAKRVLPHPASRVGETDIQIRNHLLQTERTGTSLSRRTRVYQHHIIFEVFAHKASEWATLYRKS